VNPRHLYADRHGAAGRPAVILLHGQPGSAADWDSVVPLLVSDFSVLVPDRPGYGRTGGPAAGFAGNATAVLDLLDHLKITRAIAVGHSWGGGVALALAEAAPGRVTGLVLAASVGPQAPIGWDDRILAAPLVGEAVAILTLGAAGAVLAQRWVQAFVDHRFRGRAARAVSALRGLTGADTGAPVWRSFVSEQRAYVREIHGLAPGLAELPHPTAVITGSADRVVEARVSERMARTIPGATYTVVEGAHHRLPREHPRTIAAAVLDVAARAGITRASELTDPVASDGQEAAHREG
jgi:pimeloyl-ACP methyl ester carboxylesterase